MTVGIIITLCVLILIAYAFDLSSKHTKIPTVILLLLLGWGVRWLAVFFGVALPHLNPLLPILGTVGLILIVLEGSLDLELNNEKKGILKVSTLSALIPILLLFLIIGYGFHYYSGAGWVTSFVNAIPLCIISSAIAIPSAQYLGKKNKEFVTYESSLSDIFGVIMFNFFTVNEVVSWFSVGDFLVQFAIIIVVSFVSSIGLAFLIRKIDHHVKFIPIIMMVILIYIVSKEYHLPALIFILVFGLLLNNLDEIKKVSFIQNQELEKLDAEVLRFKEIVNEVSFLVRTMFFLLFGYLIDGRKLLEPQGLLIAGSIVVAILLVRIVQIKMAKKPLIPLLFIAPRGLITILLFISIPVTKNIVFVTETLMIQVILLTALVMMLGLLLNKQVKIEDE